MDIRAEALRKHYEWAGKLEIAPRVHITDREALSLAYTPGVAEPCMAIHADVDKSYELTRSMFRQGQADALEVWQVREKLLSSENEALDALAQAVNARGALEVELGGKIEEVR